MPINKNTKTRLLFGILSGLFFAVFMLCVDLYYGERFKLLKFIFHMVAFGLFQGLVAGFYFLKNDKKEE